MSIGDRRFQKRVESFRCRHCDVFVRGNGFTNHCPHCLFSRHVDVHPGDRAAACGGLMEPVKVEKKKDTYSIVHHCLKCGAIKRNTASTADDIDTLADIARRQNL